MKEQAKEQCLYYLEIFTRTFYTKAKKEKRRKKISNKTTNVIQVFAFQDN